MKVRASEPPSSNFVSWKFCLFFADYSMFVCRLRRFSAVHRTTDFVRYSKPTTQIGVHSKRTHWRQFRLRHFWGAQLHCLSTRIPELQPTSHPLPPEIVQLLLRPILWSLPQFTIFLRQSTLPLSWVPSGKPPLNQAEMFKFRFVQ